MSSTPLLTRTGAIRSVELYFGARGQGIISWQNVSPDAGPAKIVGARTYEIGFC